MASAITSRAEADARSFWKWIAVLVFGTPKTSAPVQPPAVAGPAATVIKSPAPPPKPPVAIVKLPNGKQVSVPDLNNTIAGLADAGINVADTFSNRGGKPGGSTVTQGEIDNANANPVFMSTDNASYTAGAQLTQIASGVKKIPGVGGLAAGAINGLNSVLGAAASVLGKGTTNVVLDKTINSNAHGIVSLAAGAPRSLGAAENDND